MGAHCERPKETKEYSLLGFFQLYGVGKNVNNRFLLSSLSAIFDRWKAKLFFYCSISQRISVRIRTFVNALTACLITCATSIQVQPWLDKRIVGCLLKLAISISLDLVRAFHDDRVTTACKELWKKSLHLVLQLTVGCMNLVVMALAWQVKCKLAHFAC